MKKTIKEIDDTNDEGKLLIMAVAHITTTTHTTKTPDEVMAELATTAESIYLNKGEKKHG